VTQPTGPAPTTTASYVSKPMSVTDSTILGGLPRSGLAGRGAVRPCYGSGT
jgi:hypothetical protein